ncbi:DUF6531 domain-containing protein [Streptomyces sp. NPDC049879]|uniref:DUF6531 domain-containing protein n=1 Tax=Streptomyces sp. NPDC049879 TaxID=3365598 RepID=UPI003794E425
MDSDPTPGDPEEVRGLADELQTFSDDVAEALGKVRGLASDRAVQDWAGLSAEAFRSEFDGVPGNLEKLRDSYDLCAQALQTYWPKLQTAQGQADRALDRAIAAQADLTSAQGSLSSAQDWVGRAGDEAERLQREGERDNAPAPDEAEVRAATRDRQAANEAREAAQARVDTAQESLDAARELARQAKEMREEAARQAARDIDEASDAGIQNRKWWQKAVHWVTENWDTIVEVCKIVVAVLGVVVMIIGGPLAWVVLAAALVVLADTLIKYARGEAGLLDVAFAALDCIPGMKGLTTLGGLAAGIRGLGRVGLRGMAQGARGVARSARRTVSDAAHGAYDRMRNVVRSGGTDPVDMATGRMYLPQTDIVLPGTLPLAFTRRAESGYGTGRWFGPTWSSTVDQRLEVDDEGVVFVAEDGMLLVYPHPAATGQPVLPQRGPRWTLIRREDGGYAVSDPTTGHVRWFSPPDDGTFALLQRVSDRNGHQIDFTYDETGAPVSIRHSGGYHLRLTTDDGRVTELALADPSGAGPDTVVKRYGYTDGNLTEVINSSDIPVRFTYDERLRITSWTDTRNSRYTYTYDDQDRCVAEGGDAGHLALTLAYDGDHPDWPGHRVTTLNTAQGAVSRFIANDLSQVVAEIDPLGNIFRSEYDADHHLTARTDALGHTTRLVLNDLGQPVEVTHADGTATRYTYGEHARPTAIVHGDGTAWHWEFDPFGNCTSVTDAVGDTTRYTYDDHGRLAAITFPGGATTRVRCDAAGLPVEMTDAVGGRVVKGRDAFGRVVSLTDTSGRTSRTEWTVEGHVARATSPDGATRSWDYDGEGCCVRYTAPGGAVTEYEYTHFDLLSARVEPDGTRYAFTHDEALRLVGVTDPRGLTWDYTYDDAGRLVAERDFDGREITYRRDPVGRMAARTNAAGQTVSYTYDPRGQLVAKRLDDGPASTYAYNGTGLMTRATGPHGDIVWERDALGRVLSETTGQGVSSYRYEHGLKAARVTPTGVGTTYAYDAAGRRTALETAGHTVAFAFDAVGRQAGRTTDDFLTIAQEWDDLGRLTGQTVTAAMSQPLHRTWTYGQDGRVTGMTDSARGTVAYGHDANGRVTEVTARDWSESYAYDAAGNQTDAAWPDRHPGGDARGTRAYDGNRLLHAGAVRYSYDAAGRVTERRRTRLSRKPDVWRYDWDAEDRLTSVTTPDGTVWRYGYDPLGRRASKERLSDDGTSVVERTAFTWDGTTLVEQTTTGPGFPGPVTVTWDYDGPHPVAQTERLGAADAPQEVVDERFFAMVTDLVGAPTELVDEDGVTAWRARRTLWGTTAWQRGNTAYTPLRFPGQYCDPETGLHYNLNRHYDPDTARYTSPDPLGLRPAPNPVAYVADPRVQSDPLGLAPCRPGSGMDYMDGADNYIPSGSPVTHGETATVIGNDGATMRNYQNAANAGRHDVIAHGSRDGFLDLPEGHVNGGQIVDALRNNPNYDGSDVRLLVCHSGADSSGIAQQVANELGVTVQAPTNAVGTDRLLGPGQTPTIAEDGYWRTFLPIVPG